jgi:hypothetical protein
MIRTWRFAPAKGVFEHIAVMEGHTRAVTCVLMHGKFSTASNVFLMFGMIALPILLCRLMSICKRYALKQLFFFFLIPQHLSSGPDQRIEPFVYGMCLLDDVWAC